MILIIQGLYDVIRPPDDVIQIMIPGIYKKLIAQTGMELMWLASGWQL